MKVTTHDLIKMLPFEATFKDTLSGAWESLTPDQKIAIGQILWDEYAALYEATYEKNMKIAVAEIAEGKTKLDKELAKKIKVQTEKELQEQFNKTVPETNLAETREALQDILNNPNPQNSN